MKEINVESVKCFLGKALKIDNGTVEFTVPLEVGPRIISLQKKGGENLFFQDEEDVINRDVSAVYGAGKWWHIYGGHRLWLSPEGEDTYYPDNSPISAEILPDGVRLSTKEPWDVHNVMTEIEVRFLNANSLAVTHKVKNLSDAKPLCIWGLSVFKPGGKMEFALNAEDTGFLANRNLVLWHYTDIKDPRMELYDNKIVVKSSSKATKPLKIGCFNKNPKISYTLGSTTFKKSWDAIEGEYPDFHCNFETYTSNLIHELESLSPIVLTGKGETLVHTEYWELT